MLLRRNNIKDPVAPYSYSLLFILICLCFATIDITQHKTTDHGNLENAYDTSIFEVHNSNNSPTLMCLCHDPVMQRGLL